MCVFCVCVCCLLMVCYINRGKAERREIIHYNPTHTECLLYECICMPVCFCFLLLILWRLLEFQFTMYAVDVAAATVVWLQMEFTESYWIKLSTRHAYVYLPLRGSISMQFSLHHFCFHLVSHSHRFHSRVTLFYFNALIFLIFLFFFFIVVSFWVFWVYAKIQFKHIVSGICFVSRFISEVTVICIGYHPIWPHVHVECINF